MKTIVFINVISKWHVYGAESYIKQLICSGNYQITKIYIFVQYHHPSNKFRVANNDFIYINKLENVDLKYYFIKAPSDQNSIIRTLCKRERNNTQLIMVSAKEMNIRQLIGTYDFAKRKYIIIDEGMGENYSRKLWKLETQVLNNSSDNPLFSVWIKNVIRKIIIKFICKEVENHKILKKMDRCFHTDDEVIKAYREYFSSIKSQSIADLPLRGGDIVFVSDNLSIMLSDVEEAANIYCLVYNNLEKKFPNANIWFKPHPNEKTNNMMINKLSEFGYSILICDYAYENICCKYDVITCGFGSTSLLTSATVFNKKAYSYINYVCPANSYGKLKKKEFLEIIRDINNLEVVEYET